MDSDHRISDVNARPNYDLSVIGVVAVFDLDGTLTVRDAVVPFLIKAGGRKRVFFKAPRYVFPFAKAWLGKDRDDAKALATKVMLGGVAREDIAAAATFMAGRITGGWMREDVLARLRWHQAAGHHIVIVSASYSVYVQIVGDALGVQQVIATELGFDESGICSGDLIGGNCRGQTKAERLAIYLSECCDGASVGWCYGDSSGDMQMMALAMNAVWVDDHDLDPVAIEEAAC